MMIETDLLYAYIKTKDWLKPQAEGIINRISRGDMGVINASREVLHELYYVSMEEGVTLDDYLTRAVSLTAISHLEFLPTTHEIDLLAITLMKQYNITSIFDAYHAATALNQDPDHAIISTDRIYDKIPGINRLDPEEI